MAMNQSGEVVVAWEAVNEDVYVSTRSSSGVWENPVLISSGTSGEISGDYAVTINESSEALVSYVKVRKDRKSVV